MTRAAVAVIALAACGGGVKVDRVAIAPASRDAGAELAPIPREPAEAYALGFRWWEEQREADALRAFRFVLESVLWNGKVTVERGFGGEAAIVGDRAAFEAEGGVILASAKSGAIERFVALGHATAVTAVGCAFAVTTDKDEVVLLDPKGAVVDRIAHGSGVAPAARTFAVYGFGDQPFVELWDAATCKRAHALPDATIDSFVEVSFVDRERVLVAHDINHVDAWDAATGAKLLAYQGPASLVPLPAFSEDGRFMAYGATIISDAKVEGTTFLVDRGTRKVAATSHASRYPTGLAFADKWLAVGDLRKACLLEVPKMTLVACSAEVRPSAGIDDDLQDAHPTFVAGRSALVVETSDGSALVASVPSMTTSWKGRARLSVAEDGTSYLFDADDRALFSIGPKGAVARVRALGEDEDLGSLRETRASTAVGAVVARINERSCRVGRWVFPAAACTR